jgi:hypothetical protein
VFYVKSKNNIDLVLRQGCILGKDAKKNEKDGFVGGV